MFSKTTRTYSLGEIYDGSFIVFVNGGTYHVVDGKVYVGETVIDALTHEKEVFGDEAETVRFCIHEAQLLEDSTEVIHF